MIKVYQYQRKKIKTKIPKLFKRTPDMDKWSGESKPYKDLTEKEQKRIQTDYKQQAAREAKKELFNNDEE